MRKQYRSETCSHMEELEPALFQCGTRCPGDSGAKVHRPSTTHERIKEEKLSMEDLQHPLLLGHSSTSTSLSGILQHRNFTIQQTHSNSSQFLYRISDPWTTMKQIPRSTETYFHEWQSHIDQACFTEDTRRVQDEEGAIPGTPL
ncbi:hypothetical protein Mapa_000628 [Marchantia paleacea]|nr:hypothetical protein Mapa_000628 [Marchantia paleacea]